MKKSIESLVGKLQEDASGQLKGGFGSIRGGAVKKVKAPNAACSNTQICSETNYPGCSNTGNCGLSTNLRNCTNSNCA